MKPSVRPEEIIAASHELVEVDHYYERAFKGRRRPPSAQPVFDDLTQHGLTVFGEGRILPQGFLERVPAERRSVVEEYARKLFENARKAATTPSTIKAPTSITPFGQMHYVNEIRDGKKILTAVAGNAKADERFGSLGLTTSIDPPLKSSGITGWLSRKIFKMEIDTTRHEQEHMRQYFYDTIHPPDGTTAKRLLKEIGANTAEKRIRKWAIDRTMDLKKIPHVRGFFIRRKYRQLVNRAAKLSRRLSERQRRILAKALYHHEVTTLEDAEKIIEFVERNPRALALRQ